jgi:hypothetical protein
MCGKLKIIGRIYRKSEKSIKFRINLGVNNIFII